MSSTSLLDPRNALLAVLAIVALLYVGLVFYSCLFFDRRRKRFMRGGRKNVHFDDVVFAPQRDRFHA